MPFGGEALIYSTMYIVTMSLITRQCKQPGRCVIRYLSETHLKLKCRAKSFVPKIRFRRPIVLKLCKEHGYIWLGNKVISFLLTGYTCYCIQHFNDRDIHKSRFKFTTFLGELWVFILRELEKIIVYLIVYVDIISQPYHTRTKHGKSIVKWRWS